MNFKNPESYRAPETFKKKNSATNFEVDNFVADMSIESSCFWLKRLKMGFLN